jgi:hypothetical protein
MDPVREALIRFGMELSQMGMRADADPAKVARYGLMKMALIARDAGLECKVVIAHEHREVYDRVDGMKAQERRLAELN